MHKIAAASVGAVVTSLFTTPFDVVKTRMQARVRSSPPGGRVLPSASSAIHCPRARVCSPPVRLRCWRSGCTQQFFRQYATANVSTMATLFQLLRQEGARSLWSGLTPSLMMAVPSTALYFTAYDELRESLERYGRGGWLETYAPLFAGMIARTGAVTVTSPLELMRTKMQARRLGYGVWEGLRLEIRQNGSIRALWRGLPATLLRDVPFSAVYWLGYEKLKLQIAPLVRQDSKTGLLDATYQQSFMVSFVSGALSGSLAATLTVPFDVVKTRRQVQLYNQPGAGNKSILTATLPILKKIVADEGFRGLFAGLTARLSKVAPACAIMISCYEVSKNLFQQYPLLPAV